MRNGYAWTAHQGARARIPLEPIGAFLDTHPDLKALTAPYAVPVRWL